MRTLGKILTYALLMLLLACSATVSAGDVGAKQILPMFFTGTVYIGDDPSPTGIVVYADLAGYNETAGQAVVTSNGVYGNNTSPMMVQAGADESLRGATITFTVNGVEAEETLAYEPGVTKNLDLHFNSAALNKLNVVPIGGDVFLGEEGLDLSLFLNKGETIAWFNPTSETLMTEPAATIVIDNPKSFFIDPSQFKDKTGHWWIWSGSKAKQLAFIVKEPSVGLRIWNQNENQDISEKSNKIPAGNYVNFRLESNLYSAIIQRGTGLSSSDLGIMNIQGYSNTTKVEYQSLKGKLDGVTSSNISLRKLVVNANPWYWPKNDNTKSGWDTGALGTDGSRLYPNGQYNFSAEATLNNIKKNYNYAGKTYTNSVQATIGADSISINVTPSSVTRANSFYVTIGGRVGKNYIISVMDCSQKMTGAVCDRPPMIRSDQAGVTEGKIKFDNQSGPFSIGNTAMSANTCELNGTIRTFVPTDDKPNAKDVVSNGVYYYAEVTTGTDADPTPGYVTVEFKTGADVAAGTYQIHVQSVDSDASKVISADSSATVTKGTVTMTFNETGPYYLGNQVTLKGTNTDSDTVYLFMTGTQCQNKCGNDLLGWKKANESENIIQPFLNQIYNGCVEEADQFTCIKVPVNADGTWKYVWKTNKAPINPGTYTVYASSVPINACCLDCACAVVAMQDIVFVTPCINAEIVPDVIKKPVDCCANGCSYTAHDTMYLEGNATGYPHTTSTNNTTKELNMWIFGEEKVGNVKYINSRIPVYGDDTFKVNLLNYFSICDLKPGNYTVILQHPMYNAKFDMLKETDVRSTVDPNQIWMVSSYPIEWSKQFPLEGPGYYQGSKAVEAIKSLDNQKVIDDSFYYLTFTIKDDRVPKAEFNATPLEGSIPLEVQFTDLSVGSNLSQWSWDFGDGASSTEKNPKHTYSQAGKFTVSLTVLNGNGDSDTATKPDLIKANSKTIVADFIGAPTSGASPLKVQFTDKSTGSPNNWFWDFGDGYTAAGVRDPTHTYQYGGDYTVTLTVTIGEAVDRMVKTKYIHVVGPSPTYTPSPVDPTKVPLNNGWNFVSVSKTLADNLSTATIFKDVPTGGHAIWSYNAQNQVWDQVVTNTSIQPLYGYWIYSVAPYVVNLTFKTDPLQASPTRNLPNGWAAIGFTGSNPASAKDTFASVKEQWVYARGFDSAKQQWESTIVNGGQGEGNYLYPSKGYWLYMDKPGTLAAIGA